MSQSRFNKIKEEGKYCTFLLPDAKMEVKCRRMDAVDAALADQLPIMLGARILEGLKGNQDALTTGLNPEDIKTSDLRDFAVKTVELWRQLETQFLTDEEEEGRIDENGEALPNLPPVKVLEFQSPSPMTQEDILAISLMDRMAWLSDTVAQCMSIKNHAGREVTLDEIQTFPEPGTRKRAVKRGSAE